MEQNIQRLKSNFEKLRKKETEQTLTEKYKNEVFFVYCIAYYYKFIMFNVKCKS